MSVLDEAAGSARRSAIVPGLRMIRSYRIGWLPHDVVAGLVLTTLLVPQGMAYAELAGLPAITGLYTSILCLLGYAVVRAVADPRAGSRLVARPDDRRRDLPLRRCERGSGARDRAGVDAGAAGRRDHRRSARLAKLGFVADLLSKPTMIGYMNGLAITILVGQLPKLFGFSTDASGLVAEARAFANGVADGDTVTAALAVGATASA